jgi:hypothetical protein
MQTLVIQLLVDFSLTVNSFLRNNSVTIKNNKRTDIEGIVLTQQLFEIRLEKNNKSYFKGVDF